VEMRVLSPAAHARPVYLGEEVCHPRYTPDVEVDKKDEK